MDGPDTGQGSGMKEDLLPEERRRIIAEEEFRKAVARRFAHAAESPRERWARLLNAPAFIWLLSTVVVGLATWGYQQRTEQRQREAERRQLEVRTTDEFLYRLSACDRVDSTSNRDDVENLLSSVIGLRPLYTEFANRNLGDVYYQFCGVTSNCRFPPDSFLSVVSEIRRTTWPEIVGQPIRRRLQDPSMLPRLSAWCGQLAPVRRAARATLEAIRR